MTELSKLDVNSLAEFLESNVIYTSISFNLEEYLYRNIFYIKEITTSCEICKKAKPFHNCKSLQEARSFYSPYLNFREDFYERINGKSDLLKFQCITCEKSTKAYLVDYKINGMVVTFTKSGESPRLPRSSNKLLLKFFKEDMDEYNKAVTCLSHGFGVAAFVYMRRIIEKNINKILEMIVEMESKESPLLVEVSKLTKMSPMSDKIAIANKYMPSYLNPNGINPFGKMYSVLSEGVHSESDEECLNKAETLQACLEYIISALANHKRDTENLVKNLNRI